MAGDLEIGGDTFAVLRALENSTRRGIQGQEIRILPRLLAVACQLGVLGRPPSPPPEEARPSGRRHSPGRDAQAISHHYDIGNDFFQVILGPSMTYSCARFMNDGISREKAQEAKHELVCRKLGLDTRPGARLLDVGCGWGSMALYAATHYESHVVGITLSQPQVDLARQRVSSAGMENRVEIRL